MASPSAYRPDLLAPFLALPQGSSIQAECMQISTLPFFGEGFLICSNRRLD